MSFRAGGVSANIPKYQLFHGLLSAASWVIFAIWVIYLQERRGLSLAQVTMIDAIFFATMTVAELPTGVIADRFGRKPSMIIGVSLAIVGSMAYGLAPTVPLLILANVGWAVAFTFISGASEAFLFESLKAVGRDGEYAKVTGRARAYDLAGIVTGSVAGGLLASVDLFLPFLAAALLGLISLGLVLSFREPQPDREREGEGHTGYGEIVRQSVSLLRTRPALRLPVAYLTVVPFTALTLTVVFLQPQAVALGVPIAAIGVLVMTANGGGMLGALVSSRAAKRFGVPSVLFAVPVLIIGSLVGLVVTQSVAGLLLFALVSLLTEVTRPLVLDLLQRAVPDALRATVLSMQNLLFTLFMAITEPTLGFTADHFGLPAAYVGLAIILGVFTLVLLSIGRAWFRAGSPRE